MKLCAGYTIFNGLDLLEKSIRQIYNDVDLVIVCWQKVSNKGEESLEVEDYVKRFKGIEKVYVIEYFADIMLTTKQNEIEKHNLMLDYARRLHCTHYFLSATDHYFDTNEFREAKEFVADNDINLSFTKMYTYYKKPEWQITPIENYCMPFILKLNADTEYKRGAGYPIYVDPSIQSYPIGKWYLFEENEIMMHHYSMIRTDIKEKFRNAAASIRWAPGEAENYANEYENYSLEVNTGIKYFGGRKVRVVPNYFDI